MRLPPAASHEILAIMGNIGENMTRPTKPKLNDFDLPYHNTMAPESKESRKALYSMSSLFTKELAAVTVALEQGSEDFCEEIFRFLKWFRPERTQFPAISERLAVTPEAIRPVLEHYAFFAFRFRIWLHGRKTKSGKLRVTPVYEEISPHHLRGKLGAAGIIPARRDLAPEEDYRWNLERKPANDSDKSYRWREEGYRFFELIVDDRRASDLMRIVDTFYDPVALNFREITRRISRKREHHYLICMIGELSDRKAWRDAESMRTKMIKELYDASTRGRKADPLRTRIAMHMAAKYGTNVKASANESLTESGRNSGIVSDKEYRRSE